jgi:uncharacterized membrane protein
MKGLILAIACIVLGVWVHIHYPEESRAVGHGVVVIVRGLVNVVQEATKEQSPAPTQATVNATSTSASTPATEAVTEPASKELTEAEPGRGPENEPKKHDRNDRGDHSDHHIATPSK